MRDFNFFSPYIENRRSSTKKTLLILITAVIIATLVSGVYYFYELQIIKLEKELASMETYLNSPQIAKNLEEVNKLREKLKAANQYYDAVREIYEDINKINKIDSRLVSDITKALPQDISLEEISITNDGVLLIEGISQTRTSVAEFEYNINSLDWTAYVHVQEIKQDSEKTENLRFVMSCIFN